MSTLATYCINLDRRTDRWQESLANYASVGLSANEVSRWSASQDEDFGALGCAKSHVAVLGNFLTRRSEPYCLVMEDDFDFLCSWGDFVGKFNNLQSQGLDWDALLLSGTCTVAYSEAPPGVARVVESQSTSGYMLQRRYVPAVLHSFSQSVVMLEKFREYKPRENWTIRFAIDQAWKTLQRTDRWYICSPAAGHQRASFSDIEQKQIDYAELSWRGNAG
jgi:GR25 family glycosyltransferase involved in LPS biosynthesis